MRNFVSFMMIAISVMIMGVGSQWFQGQLLPLIICILAAGIIFVSGLMIHKRGVKK